MSHSCSFRTPIISLSFLPTSHIPAETACLAATNIQHPVPGKPPHPGAAAAAARISNVVWPPKHKPLGPFGVAPPHPAAAAAAAAAAADDDVAARGAGDAAAEVPATAADRRAHFLDVAYGLSDVDLFVYGVSAASEAEAIVRRVHAVIERNCPSAACLSVCLSVFRLAVCVPPLSVSLSSGLLFYRNRSILIFRLAMLSLRCAAARPSRPDCVAYVSSAAEILMGSTWTHAHVRDLACFLLRWFVVVWLFRLLR